MAYGGWHATVPVGQKDKVWKEKKKREKELANHLGAG